MQKIYLNDEWLYDASFAENMVEVSFDDSLMERVRLPHTNVELPYNYLDEKEYQFVSCYRKKLFAPAEWEGKTVLLTFEGAGHIADVYVNGEHELTHECGYTAFTLDLTGKLKIGQENVIAVRLDSTENPAIPPFGHVIDYLTYGGIYREVYLEVGEPVYLADVFVSTPQIGEESVVDAVITVDGPVQDSDVLLVRGVLKDAEGNVIWSGKAPLKAGVNRRKIRIKKEVDLWDIDTPNLYYFDFTLLLNGEETDQKTVRFGFRTVEFKNDGFYLNGKMVKLRGLNRHQCYPYVGYAMPKSMQVMDADVIKYELGLNAVRTSHYPQSQHFIDRCDEIGVLVLTEIPGWQHIGEGHWKDVTVKNTEEMVLQYRNHPSIMLWGVRINESPDDDEMYARTNEAAHALDSSRQTGGIRNIIHSSFLEDVYTYNDFNCNGERAPLKDKTFVTGTEDIPYVVTENNGHMFPTKSFDHEGKRLEHAYRHAQVQDRMYATDGISGAFGWCMFDYNTHKDFGSGDRICYHGVMDMFRNPKLAAAVYASQAEAPVLELSSTMDIGEHPAGVFERIMAFTNADVLRVYKNGELIKEYVPDHETWPGLPHPPILIDDFVGNQLETKEGVEHEDSEAFKKIMKEIGKLGPNGICEESKMTLGGLLEKYHWTMNDAVELFNKYVANWGTDVTTYRYEGVKDGEVFKVVTKNPATELHLHVEADHTDLVEEATYDMAAVRVRVVDQNGNQIPFFSEAVVYQTEGPIEVVGPAITTLPGGMGGTYVKTIGEEGEASLTVTIPGREAVKVDFHVTDKKSKDMCV